MVSSTANGSYSIGAVIALSLQFSEAVFVNSAGGTPRLLLETGAIDRYAIYTSGSGSNTLVFSYTVQAGDNSADLDQVSSSALELNGASIKDAAGNNAILTLAAPGAPGSLAANAALVIDTTPPGAPSLTLTDTGISSTDRITNNGSIVVGGVEANANWQYSTNGGTSWSVALNATTTSFSIGQGSYTTGQVQVRQIDAAGNISPVNSSFQAFTVDTSAPAVSSVVATGAGISGGNGYLNAGKLVSITINTSEPITISGGIPTLSLNSGGSAAYASGSGTNALVFNYTVTAGDTASDLSVTGLNVNGAILSDAAGNSFASFSNNPAGTLVIDTTAPATPTLALANDSGVSNSDGITNNGTVSVTGLEAGVSWQYSTNVGSSWVNGTGSSFVLSSGSYNAGSILVRQSDLAGNVSANGQLGAITVDSSAPLASSVVVTGTGISGGNGNLNAGKVVTITVNTSEPVTISGGIPTLSLNSGGIATYASGSGTNSLVFSYTVLAGNSAGDLAVTSLNANGASISDSAGNSLASFSSNPAGSLVIDTTSPAVSSVSAAGADINSGNCILNAGKVVTITVNTTEPVTISGGIPTLSLNSGGSATYASGSGTNSLIFSYTVAAGNNASDLAITGLNANGASIADPAGNSLTSFSFNPAGTLVVDTIAPTGSLNPTAPVSSTTVNGIYGIGAVINLVVQFSEAVFVNTTSGTPRLQLETGAIDRYAIYTGGSGTNTLSFSYTVQAGDSSADLDQVSSSALELNGGTIKDAAGNNANFSLAAPGGVGSLAANAAIVIATAPPNSHLFTTVTQLVWDQNLDSFIAGTTYSDANFMLAEVSGTGRPFQGDKDGNLNAKTWEKVRFGDLFGEYLPMFTSSSYYYYYGAVNSRSLGGWGLFLTNQNDEFYLLDVDGNCNLSPGTNIGSWDSWLPNTYYFATNVVCFVAGTQIRTPQGERAIETLQPGDLISTANGVKPVKFVSRNTRHFNELLAVGKSPIRVAASAFGAAGPTADLLMSPSHALCLEGTLIEAAALLDHAGVSRVDEWQSQQLTYFNIELEQHELIWANGALTESYFSSYRSNGFSRQSWDNFDEYRALYGDGELMQELPMPRIAFSRQLPAALRARLQVKRVDLDLADLDLFTLEQPDQLPTNLNWSDELPTDLDLINLNRSDCSRQGGNRLQPIKLHLNSQPRELSLAL